MPNKINREWHEQNCLPKNATLEQRAKWHEAHLKHCACRTDLPPKIAELLSAKSGKAEAKGADTVKKFNAVLKDAGGGGVYVDVPFDVEKVYGTRGRVPVQATIDGEPYRGSLAKMGGDCHMFPVLKAIRAKIGKQVGDKVKIELVRDTAPRVVEVPVDLQKALNKSKSAKAIFDKLSYSHRKEYVQWIEEAKREETRAERILKTIEKLSAGENLK